MTESTSNLFTINQQDETWRPVVGREHLYSVSSHGRIRREAPGGGSFKGKILKPIIIKGYWHVCFYRPDLKCVRLFAVHRLEAAAFFGVKPSPSHQVNHKDGNKLNNHLDNLEYVTPSENLKHAVRHFLLLPPRKLCPEKVREIRSRRDERSILLAQEFGVSQSTIQQIWNGRNWHTVT